MVCIRPSESPKDDDRMDSFRSWCRVHSVWKMLVVTLRKLGQVKQRRICRIQGFTSALTNFEFVLETTASETHNYLTE